MAELITEVLVRDGERVTLRTRTIHVEVLTGPNAGQIVELAGPEARIGTGKTAHLVLFDAAVSRHHLTIRLEAEGVRVVDAGSRNGTLLDGVRIVDAYARPESVIALGTTTMKIHPSAGVIEIPLSARDRFGGMLGRSAAMRQAFTMLERVARTDTTVLIEGETGTGKELAAEGLHEESPRAGGPYVVFDCSAVSPTLIESELFGHVRGAFTGAVSDREGAFEAADGGTLFIDEIGELPLELQPKLLRVLEQREVRRLGASEPRAIDVRIVAATHRDLEAEIAARRFREDLFYRLAVVRVELPPLRRRGDDVGLLVDHFARDLERRQQGRLDAETRAQLVATAWPGNVRELRNGVARAMALGGAAPKPRATTIAETSAVEVDLAVPFHEAREAMLEAFERAYLIEALRACDGNATKAAERAGVNRKLLQRAIKKYDLRAALVDDE